MSPLNFTYFNIFLAIVLVALFLYLLFLTLTNKFDHKFLQNSLNENIINLLNSKKYTEKTLTTIKLLLVLRSIFFIMAIMLCVFGYYVSTGIFIVIPLMLFVYYSNIKIENQLQRDYEHWCEKHREN